MSFVPPLHRRVGAPALLSIGAGMLLAFSCRVAVAAPPATPGVTATMEDSLQVDSTGEGRTNRGDTLRYDVNISVGQDGTTATGVGFTNVLPPELQPVAGSIEVSPIGRDDAYAWFGNTELAVGGAQGVLANDSDFDGDVLSVVAGTTTTALGGSVTLAADGSFTYYPPAGISDVTDSFRYELTDGTFGDSARASVSLTQKIWYVQNNAPADGDGRSHLPFDTLLEAQDASAAGDIIYVDAGDGTSAKYGSGIVLKDSQRLIGEGVALRVGGTTLRAAGTAPALTGTGTAVIELASSNVVSGVGISATGSTIGIRAVNKAGGVLEQVSSLGSQALLLSGHSGSFVCKLSLLQGAVGSGNRALAVSGSSLSAQFESTTLSQSGGLLASFSGLTNSSVTFDSACTVTGLTGSGMQVTGNSGSSVTFNCPVAIGTSGARASSGVTFTGNSNSSSLSFTNALNVYVSGVPAVVGIGTGSSSSLNIAGGTLSSAGGAAFNLDTLSGTLSGLTLSSTSSTSEGLRLSGFAGSLTAVSTAISSSRSDSILVQNCSARSFSFGATSITQAGQAGTGDGIDALTGNSGTSLGFSSLSIGTSNGRGLAAAGISLSVNDPPSISASGGASIDLSDTTLSANSPNGFSFTTLSSTNSTAEGIRLSQISSRIYVSGAVSVVNPVTEGIELASLSGAVTFNNTVSVSSADQEGIEVSSYSGSQCAFNGAVTVSGSLGEAIKVSSATGGVTFGTVSLGTWANTKNGVLLTASSGAITLASSAGSIAIPSGATVPGVSISGCSNVTIRGTSTAARLAISGGGAGAHSIHATNSSGVTLENLAFATTGDTASAAAEHGVLFENYSGAITVRNNTFRTIRDGDAIHFRLPTAGSTPTVTISSNEIGAAGAVADVKYTGINFQDFNGGRVTLTVSNNTVTNTGADGVDLEFLGSSGSGDVNRVTVSGNNITGCRSSGLELEWGDSSRTRMNISSNTLNGQVTSGAATEGLMLGISSGTAQAELTVQNSTFRNNAMEGVILRSFGLGTASTITAKFDNNDINSNGQATGLPGLSLQADDNSIFNMTLTNNRLNTNGQASRYGFEANTNAFLRLWLQGNNDANGYTIERSDAGIGTLEIACVSGCSPSTGNTNSATIQTIVTTNNNNIGTPVTVLGTKTYNIILTSSVPQPSLP